jgi:radical SAM protein with 4Fe4S-binding SPASM domain
MNQTEGIPKKIVKADALRYLEKRLEFPIDELLLFPKYFLIETINRCNAKCIMCGIDFSSKQKMTMDPALFDKITKEIGQYKDHVEKVMLYLDGEPLLDKNISQRISAMKKAGVKRVNIATNASLLNEKVAENLLKSGLDEIYITIDSLHKDVYESIRVGLSFDTVKENILRFIRMRNQLNPQFAIRIQMILQEANKTEEYEFIEFWKTQLSRTDQVVVQKAHNWGSTVDVMKFGDENEINNVPCIALWGTLCIHVDGTVGLCCMDTKNIYPLGNLGRQSIAEIWRGTAMQSMRNMHEEGRRHEFPLCDKCTVWRESKHDVDGIIGE